MKIRDFKPVVRNFAWRALSPKYFHFARYCWWYPSFYLPRMAASRLIESAPEVHGFGAGGTSDLVGQLRSVNVYSPTRMCRVMTRWGSDKGNGWHNYTSLYSVLFTRYLEKHVRIFELGVGSTNPSLMFTRTYGVPGASLRGWRELFPNAVVLGADIDRTILFRDDRITTYYCDQLDRAAIRDLWSAPDLRNGADIIIDDGLHSFQANALFLEESIGHLRPGGTYVVEDIKREYKDRWCQRLETVYCKLYATYEFAFVELPHSFSACDNNLLIIRRPLNRAP